MYRALLWGVLVAWPCVAVGDVPTALSATCVQNNAQKNVYNWIQQSDETQKTPYWNFRTVLSERYPFLKPFQVLYLNNPDIDTQPANYSYLQIDLDRVRKILSDTAAFPAGTYIGLDLEGRKWSIYSYQIARPNPGWINTNVIAAKAEIITAVKAMRPDCYFGFYGLPESNEFAGTLGRTLDVMGQLITDESLDELEAASKPVIDVADFIAPDLYWYHNYWSASDVTLWVKKVVDRTRKYSPGKKIIPFTSWVMWSQITADMTSQGYPWTPAAVAQVTVSGPDWRQFLNALSDAGVNDIILYTDGTWMPWDPQAPWWLQTCDWASTPRKISPPSSCNSTANPSSLCTRIDGGETRLLSGTAAPQTPYGIMETAQAPRHGTRHASCLRNPVCRCPRR